MEDIPKIKLTRLSNGELYTTNIDDRDKKQIEEYINNVLINYINSNLPDLNNYYTKPETDNKIVFKKNGNNWNYTGNGLLLMNDENISLLGDAIDEKDAVNLRTLNKEINKLNEKLNTLELKFQELKELGIKLLKQIDNKLADKQDKFEVLPPLKFIEKE